VAAHGQDACARAAEVPAEQQQVRDHLHVEHAFGVLRESHAEDADDAPGAADHARRGLDRLAREARGAFDARPGEVPQVIGAKTATMADIGASPTAELRPVAVDLRDDWPAALRTAGLDVSQPTAWSAEGLLVYLPPDAQDRLLDNITALSAPESQLATEYHPDGGASMFGALGALGNAGGIFMPWLVGWIADLRSLPTGLAISTVAPAAMLGLVLWLGRQPKRPCGASAGAPRSAPRTSTDPSRWRWPAGCLP
jgi:hypothetical protein